MIPGGPLGSLVVPWVLWWSPGVSCGPLWSSVQPNNLTSASAASSSRTNMEGNWGPHICCLWHASSKFGFGFTLCQSIHSSLHLWVVHRVVSVVDRQSISSPCAPSSCEALSLCPVLSCALLLACTMHYSAAQLVWGVMIWYVGTVC